MFFFYTIICAAVRCTACKTSERWNGETQFYQLLVPEYTYRVVQFGLNFNVCYYCCHLSLTQCFNNKVPSITHRPFKTNLRWVVRLIDDCAFKKKGKKRGTKINNKIQQQAFESHTSFLLTYVVAYRQVLLFDIDISYIGVCLLRSLECIWNIKYCARGLFFSTHIVYKQNRF